jgi:nicotinamide-nucleotide amidase
MTTLDDIFAHGGQAGALLRSRNQTVAVSESSTGGLISAALLSVPGASAYFIGGGVIYTRQARNAFLQIDDEAMSGMRGASEPYALLTARIARDHCGASWGIGETGATGPTGNRYGDAAGHSCIAVVGARERVITIETGRADRLANMYAFTMAALELLIEQLR